jgi:hypothetical protein
MCGELYWRVLRTLFEQATICGLPQRSAVRLASPDVAVDPHGARECGRQRRSRRQASSVMFFRALYPRSKERGNSISPDRQNRHFAALSAFWHSNSGLFLLGFARAVVFTLPGIFENSIICALLRTEADVLVRSICHTRVFFIF